MKIAAYGAGKDFENFLLLMRSNKTIYDDEIVMLVDGDQSKWGQKRGDLTIESPNALVKASIDAVVITSLRYADEIEKGLKEKYPELKYYTIGGYREKKTIEYHYHANMERNLQNKEDSFHKFNDDSMVIYTGIFGDYDELHEPLVIDPKVDYICFTDQANIKSDVWKIKHVENNANIDLRLFTRQFKLMPHRFLPEYATSVWMDASMQITNSIVELIHKYQVCSDMLFFPHEGTCIYDIALGEQYREKKEKLLRQMVTYYEDGYPIDNGIIFGGFLVRNHNQNRVIDAMEEWYSHVEKYSMRDQLSLPYVLWKQNLSYDLTCESIYRNDYYQILDHKSLAYVNQKM